MNIREHRNSMLRMSFIACSVLAGGCGGKSPMAPSGATATEAGAGGQVTPPAPSGGSVGQAGALGAQQPAGAAAAGGASGAGASGKPSGPAGATEAGKGGTPAAGSGGATAGPDQPAAGSGPGMPTEFDCSDLSKLNMAVFPTEDEAWALLVRMVDEMGPRHAGSMGDKKWTDFIEQRMKDSGLVDIKRMDTMVTGTNGLSGQGQPTSGTSTHLVGVLPGMSDQIISIGCHKDGPNSVEENGTVIALAVVEYYSKLPKTCRKHSLALSFPTCHMATCTQADVPAWNRMFPDVVSKTIAWLAPEHAGHKRRPADGGTTIEQAFLCTTPGLKKECEALLADIRMTTGESAKQWFTTTEALGSSAAWSGTTGKPTVGSMSYWDTLAAGLTDTSINTTGIDKRTFYQVMMFYARVAGWIDGHPTEL